MKKILIVTLIMLFFTCSTLLGDPKDKRTEEVTDDKGKLAGKVTDEKGDPISKANIIIESTEFQTQSKKSGSYSIANIPTGKYNVICESSGFETDIENDVTIKHNQTTTLNFVLVRQAVKDKPKLKKTEEESKNEIKKPTKTSSGKTTTKKETKDDSDKKGDEIRGGEIEIIETISATTLDPYEEAENVTIRGGRSDEMSYTVDGMSVSDPVDGGAALTIDTDAVSALKIKEAIKSPSKKPRMNLSLTVLEPFTIDSGTTHLSHPKLE